MPDTIPMPKSVHFVVLTEHRPVMEGGVATRYARLQNTLVAWSDVVGTPATLRQDSSHEVFVVLPDCGATLIAGSTRVAVPARSIAILPAGAATIEPHATGRIIRFFSPVPEALGALAVNAADYATPRAKVNPIGAPLAYSGNPGIRVYEVDHLRAERPKPGSFRPPTFQTATMNLLWIEQNGPQDPGRLAPHSHDDFEEGALVVEGEYIQHLRTPWDSDSRQWREDEHHPCSPGTITIVPPMVVHANEARGHGRHIMLNVFAPARADHIKSGMVLNAAEYQVA